MKKCNKCKVREKNGKKSKELRVIKIAHAQGHQRKKETRKQEGKTEIKILKVLIDA